MVQGRKRCCKYQFLISCFLLPLRVLKNQSKFTSLSQIIDGMHLNRQSRNLVSNYCRDSVYHHLFIEFDCSEKDIEENIKDTAKFYQNIDNNQDWLQTLVDKCNKYGAKFEKCSPYEGPLITVHNSENPLIHTVTARGVQGLLQTTILGVLSSTVIRSRTFFFSRVSRKQIFLEFQ